MFFTPQLKYEANKALQHVAAIYKDQIPQGRHFKPYVQNRVRPEGR